MTTQHRSIGAHVARPLAPRAARCALLLSLLPLVSLACGTGSPGSTHLNTGGGTGSSGAGGGQGTIATTGQPTLTLGDAGNPARQGDGGTSPGDLAACAKSTQKIELMPLDLGLLVDTSASMDYDSKWVKVSGALAIVSESSRYANVGMALQYFPLRLACDEPSYAKPDVSMGTLPGVGDALRASLSLQRMSGGTPLVQALRGMGNYLTTWATANPTHRTALVVATDGIPDSTCAGSTPPNSLSEAVTVAGGLAQGTLFTGAPKVLVFVIGVGSDLTALNAIAKAGGSGSATLVSTGADVDQQFIAALDSIRKQTMTCDYPIPAPQGGGQLDLTTVNVAFSQAGTTDTLTYVPSAADCALAAGKGWTFDNPTTPTKVVLCSDTCDRVNTATDGGVDVVFGCTRVELPK